MTNETGFADHLLTTPRASASTLIALAERVEQAQGPDRLLDAEIAAAIGAPHGPEETVNYDGRSISYVEEIAPFFTASLDAAVRLVPEGDAFTVGQNVHHGHWVASVNYLDAEGEPTSRGCSNACCTPALALTAAALRAHAAMGGE